MISATVTFKLGSKPAQITLERASDKNPWRFLSADAALVMVPVCGHFARIVETPPLFERLEVWPCAWGFPHDLAEAHPQAVEQLRREHAAAKDGLAWDEWFARIGREELWRRVATDEMHRAWLNTADCFGDGPGPGFALWMRAKPDTTPWPCIAERDLLSIRFRADFHNGDRGETVYLAECLKQPLTPEEVKTSWRYLEQEERRQREQEKQLGENLAAHHATQTMLGVVDKKSGQILDGVDTLKAMAGERTAAQAEWAKNPLGCGKEAIADCLLALEAAGIKSNRAVALLRYAYGATAKQCAVDAKIALATFKRDLKKAKGTPYKPLFARTPKQRQKAIQELKNPSEIMALVTRLAELDPERLRNVLAPILIKRLSRARGEPQGENVWDATVAGST
jgi:hypothetical protein